MSAYGTILAAISRMPYWNGFTVDTFRDATDAAQLRSPEIAGALRSACIDGYIKPMTYGLPDGGLGHIHQKSTHEPAKGRWVMVYRRTGKAIPEHLCRTPKDA